MQFLIKAYDGKGMLDKRMAVHLPTPTIQSPIYFADYPGSYLCRPLICLLKWAFRNAAGVQLFFSLKHCVK